MIEIQQTKDIKVTRLNALLYGDSGTGKTRSLQTLASLGKVFVFCTDEGGMTTLRGLPDIDFVYIDSIPTYEEALKEFETNRISDYASVACDSLTTISELLMDHVIRLSGRAPASHFAKRPPGAKPGQGILLGPNQQDYGNQMTLIQKFISYMIKLPLHVVFTAHVELNKDELSGRIKGEPMVTGKLKGRLPLLFDEVYLSCRQSGKYYFRTRPDPIHVAKSRLSKGELLDELEEPDFTRILTKAGVLG